MKRLFFLGFFFFSCIVSYAQTQQGYVKTKGRMISGKYYEGQRIQDATIQIKDRSAVITKKDGSFSFSVPSRAYSLQKVEKQGYILLDQDVLYRQYTYSSDPLVLVMEDKAQLEADRRALERQIRRVTDAELQRRSAELDSLKEQNRITEEKYRELLSKLNDDYDNNESLIKDMVDHYNRLDFDLLDEFNRRVTDAIINGNLDEADSLIRTKGNIEKRIEHLHNHVETNKRTRDALKRSEIAEELTRQDIAQDCYNKYLVFKMRHLNDSAAYYIENRADIDNGKHPEWQNDAGIFIAKYIAEYSKAAMYFNKAIVQGKEQGYIPTVVESFIYLGMMYYTTNDFEQSEIYIDSALYLVNNYLGELSKENAIISNQLGLLYQEKNQFEDAMRCYEKSIELYQTLYGDDSVESAGTYGNLGALFHTMAQYDKAMEYYKKALSMYMNDTASDNALEIASITDNIAIIYGDLGDYSNSLLYHKKALEQRLAILGDNHPYVAVSFHNIGSAYGALQSQEDALHYYQKAYELRKKIFGKNNLLVANSYSAMGATYYSMKDLDIAKKMLLESLDIYALFDKLESLDAASIYVILGAICIDDKEYDKALEYTNRLASIYKESYGENHPYYSLVLSSFADILDAEGYYQEASDYYTKSYMLLLNYFPDDHPAVQLIKEQAEATRLKINQ